MEYGAGGEGPVASAGSGSRKHELVPQLQLPPGFRYVPTDEELVDVYLRCKIEGRTPPLDIVNEVDIMRSDPQKLIETYKGYGENRWYFFTVREPSKTNKKDEPNRKVVVDGVEVGGWIATGSVTKIHRTSRLMDQETIIGTKRILTYRSILSAEDNKWSMHEYIMSGKSQMGQYALCAIQLKQTYEAEKKAGEEGKNGNEGKRRVARKGTRENQSTCQGQEEQHKTSSPGKITDDTYPLEGSFMQVMFGEEQHEQTPSFSQCNNNMVQAIQTGEPVTWFDQGQPLLFLTNQSLIEPGCNGNLRYFQDQFYTQVENRSVVFREALDQRQTTTWENPNVYSGTIFSVGNVEDYTQSQLCNQDNVDVFFGAFEDSTNELHDTFVLSRQEIIYNDAIDQSMAIQHVGEDSMGDGDAEIYYADDISSFHTNNDSLLDGDGDHVREQEM